MALLPHKPPSRLVIDLEGPEGNAFALLGLAGQLAKQLGIDAKPILAEMTKSDYRHLVEAFDTHFGEYVDLTLPSNWDSYEILDS